MTRSMDVYVDLLQHIKQAAGRSAGSTCYRLPLNRNLYGAPGDVSLIAQSATPQEQCCHERDNDDNTASSINEIRL